MRSILCDYSDSYILVKGTITVRNKVAANQLASNANIKLIHKNWEAFNNCISRIKYTYVDDAHDTDIMPMYNLIEYSNNYSKNLEVYFNIVEQNQF